MNCHQKLLLALLIGIKFNLVSANEPTRVFIKCSDVNIITMQTKCTAKYNGTFAAKVTDSNTDKLRNDWRFGVESLLIAAKQLDQVEDLKKIILESTPKLDSGNKIYTNTMISKLNLALKRNSSSRDLDKSYELIALNKNQLNGVWWDKNTQIVPFIILLDGRILLVSEISWNTVSGMYEPIFGASLTIESLGEDNFKQFNSEIWKSISQFIFLRSTWKNGGVSSLR